MVSLHDTLGELTRGTTIIFFGTVFGRVLALLGQVLVVQALSPKSFGHLALAYTIVSSVSALGMLGVHEGTTKLLSSTSAVKQERRILGGSYAIGIIGGSIVAATIYAFRMPLAKLLEDQTLPELLVLFMPFLLIYPLARISLGALRARRRSLSAVVSRDIGPRLLAIGVFIAATLAGRAFVGAVVYWTIIPTMMLLFCLYFLWTDRAFARLGQLRPNQETVRELWSFSWPLALSSSLFIILSNFDVLMIGYFLQPRFVGYYRSIQPLQQVTTFVVTSFTFLYLPIATEFYDEGNLQGLNRLYRISTKWISIATYPLVLLLILFSADIIRVLFGGEYLPAKMALSILVGGTFVRAMVGLTGDMIKAINRTKIVLYSAVAGAVINIVLNILLIPQFGIEGAALATVCGYAAHELIEVGVVYRALGSHPFTTNSLKPLVPVTLVGVILSQLTVGIELGLFALAVLGCALLVAQLISLVLTRSLGDADLLLIRQLEGQTGVDLGWLKTFL